MLKKFLLIFLGFIFLAVGIVGIFIPILPTTPLIVLASVMFSLSNKKIYDYLANTKYLGAYIRNYRNKTGVPLKTKVLSIIYLWVSLFASCLFIDKYYVHGILLGVGLAVSLHIILLKTQDKNK